MSAQAIKEATRFIEEQKYQEAAKLLEPISKNGASADGHGLLGLAYFYLEKYPQAHEQLAAAAKKDPKNKTWSDLAASAESNATAEIDVPVPDFYFFEANKLLADAAVPDGALPPPPRPPRRPSFTNRVRIFIGNCLGKIATILMKAVTGLWGKLAGYKDRVWTNWYRRSLTKGILTLAYMRDKLNKKNLKNTYPEGALIGFQTKGQRPPEGVTHYRTADGTWNNLENPKEGAAGTRFGRNVDDSVAKAETDETLLSPNPRVISNKLLTRDGDMKEIPFLNMLAATWIQFQNHDWVNHGEVLTNDLIEIPLPEDDPAREKYRQSKMFVGRTQADPTRKDGKERTPSTFINEVTHWWDGSQLYGSDQETVDRLRSGVDGKLKLQENGKLPLDKKNVEDTGFVRNWWVGLSLLHTLFAREHNSICDHLKTFNPSWDDTRLFNVARLINAAVMAKIHTVEWTPAVLPNEGLDSALNANWYGIATNLFKVGRHRKTLAGINLANPELGGVVGNPTDKHGEPYSLTQEFVEVYRLHSLLPETLKLSHIGEKGETEEVPLPATRQAGSPKITDRFSMADLLHSFGKQLPGQLVLNNFPKFMQELSIPGNPVFDMGAIDILRARERGVPRYNEFRRQLGLNPISSFDDLTDDKEQVAKIKEVYGDRAEDVEKLDLLVGTLSEGHRPTGFGFGETMFQIFILNATRRLQADRFYTDCYNEETYTREGLQWIDDADLKTVLLRNYPELAKTDLANVTNAFEPWEPGERLNRESHPLREYNKALEPDPWTGDAHR